MDRTSDQKKDVLVSVIMPSFNHGKYILEAIQSVLDQTHANLELIVVDNFSEDDTDQVVAQLDDPRLKVMKFNNEGIIAKARNYGVKQAQGELLAFLDTDDIWVKNKLALQIPYLFASEGYGVVSSNFDVIGELKYFNNHLMLDKNTAHSCFNLDDMVRLNRVMTSSVMVRKFDFDRLSGFDESRDFAFIEDWELWLRFVHDVGNVCVVHQPLLHYRVIKNKKRDVRTVKLNLLKIAEKLQVMGYIDAKQYGVFCDRCCLDIANAHLEAGDRLARRYYLKTLFASKMPVSNRLKSLAGLVLTFFPRQYMVSMLGMLYSFRRSIMVFCSSRFT